VTAVADAVPEHLRERFGEPVQTHLARRGWRSDEGRRCRAVHALRKAERRTILASAHVERFRGPNRPHGSDRELHRECRGRRCGGVRRRCAGPRVETGVSASPCLDAEGTLGGKSTCGRLPTSPTTFQGVPRGPQPVGHHRQRRVQTPPSGFPMAVRRGNPARRSESVWARPDLRPEAREGNFPPGKSGFSPSKYKGFPRSSSERRWRYCMCPVAQSARSRAEPSSASPKARRAKETHR